jgi:hypothetical protein
MKWILRVAIVVAALAMLWPEWQRYRAEWWLAAGNARLTGVLNATVTGPDAVAVTQEALHFAQLAAAFLSDDPRPVQSASIALLMLQRGDEAIALLEPAIRAGERPELTINLGRARGISGNAVGADAAFLRTTWINPASTASLPSAIRQPLLVRVKEMEQQLRDGHLHEPPPLQ